MKMLEDYVGTKAVRMAEYAIRHGKSERAVSRRIKSLRNKPAKWASKLAAERGLI